MRRRRRAGVKEGTEQNVGTENELGEHFICLAYLTQQMIESQELRFRQAFHSMPQWIHIACMTCFS